MAQDWRASVRPPNPPDWRSRVRAPEPEQGPGVMGTLRDMGRQVRRSFHETGAGISETLGGLLGTADETSRDAMRGLDAVRMSPEEPSRLRRAADYLTEVDAPASRASAERMGAPETTAGTLAGIGSRIAFESAPYVAGGLAGAGRVVAGASLPARIGSVAAGEAAVGLPLDLAQGYHRRPEESLASAVNELAPESGIGRLAGRAAETPAGRALFEATGGMAAGLGIGAGIETARSGARALRSVADLGVEEAAQRGIREGLEESTPSWVGSVRPPPPVTRGVPLRSALEQERLVGDPEAASPERVMGLLSPPRDPAVAGPPQREGAGRTIEPPRRAVAEEAELSTAAEIASRRTAQAGPRLRSARQIALGEAGAVQPGLVGGLARTGAGAAVGAGVDDENRLRGALVGGAAALGAPAAVRGLRGLGNAGRVDFTSQQPARWSEGKLEAAIRNPETPRIAPEEVDDFVNVAKFALDPTGEARLRTEVQNVVQAHGLSPKEVISWDQTRSIAKSMGLDGDKLDLKLQGRDRLGGPEMLAIRNVVNSNVRQIESLSQQLATGMGKNGEPLGEGVAEQMSRAISGMESQNDNLLSRFISERSQTGRDLNNLKILANQTMEPTTWMMRAQRIADGPISEEVKANIRRLINENDRAGLAKYVSGLRQSTLGEKATTLWKAGLLTGPPTHIVNMLSNTASMILETAKDAPAAIYDHLLGLVTGMATKSFNVGDLARAAKRGAVRGVKEARQVMRGLPTDDALKKYDYFREVNYDSPILNAYTKFVFRALGAGDRLFRGFSLERSLGEQARTLAQMEGLRGEALTKRVAELVANPPDEIAMRAIADAEVATFTNKGKLGALAGSVKRTARQKSDVLGAAADVVAPFTATPSNVATRVVEYSPLGAISTIPDVVRIFKEAARGNAVPAVQRRVVERLGRSTIGSAPILVGYILHQNGLMSLGYPDDQGERGQWTVTGRQENSVLIGGKWRSLERFSPLGNLMVLGGYIHETVSDPTKTTGQKIAEPVASIAKTVSEQSFLEGVNRILNAIQDPEREAEGAVRSLARSVIPNIVQRVGRIMDPTLRESDTIGGEVLRGVPGLSRGFPAQLDEFGEPLEHEGGIVGSLFDPLYSRTAKTDDPVRGEIDRVNAGLTARRPRSGESPDQFRERLRIEGRVLRGELSKLIGSRAYQSVPQQVRQELGPADPRIEELTTAIQRAMLEETIAQTRSQLTRELTRTAR